MFYKSPTFTLRSYAKDIYPFGSLIPNRHGSSDDYRYGFNGKENDWELKGDGNSYDFGARMYDPRIGRWFATDRLESLFPGYSTYNYSLNNPIYFIDPDGNGPLDWYKDKFGNFVFDKNIKSQKDLGNKGTYLGATAMVETFAKGKWVNTYGLNANGSVNDSFGKNYMDNFGSITITKTGVKIINEYTISEKWEDKVVAKLRKADEYVRSLEGNGTMKGAGFKINGEISINKYSLAFDLGTYSSKENTVGGYSKFSINTKEHDISGGITNGWGSAGSALISIIPKFDIGASMYVNTQKSLDISLNPSTTNSVMGQYGSFRVGGNDGGEYNIGFGFGTGILKNTALPIFNPDKGINVNSTSSKPIEFLTGATGEINLED